MRKIAHSLIVASAMLTLGISTNTASAVCNCKVHRHKKHTCDCSGSVPARRPDCSCHTEALESHGESSGVPSEADAPPEQHESMGEPSVEDNAPVEKAIEETPTEAPLNLESIEAEPIEGEPVEADPATAPNEGKPPINVLPESDDLSSSPSDAPQNGSSATKRLRDAINTRRPYAQPTLDKVPNPPVPDTTEVQLREIPIEFDSYGYLNTPSAAPRPSKIGSSYRASRHAAARTVVTWSAKGEAIK